jgi:two-component system sensor histidine kinase YesM
MLGQNIGSMYVKNVTERDFGYFSDIESASLVSFAQINNSGLIIVKTTEEDVLFKDMNVTRNYLIFVCLLGIVVSVVAAYFISLQVSIPVKALDSGMKRVRQGNLSARVEIKSKDEFGRLGDTFNKMLERINQLIFDLKQEQESKRIAEIQSLQSRINPHFLYNTLSSIRYLISMGQQEIAEGAILSLIRLFKKMSGKDGELINIEEEVDLLNDYMKIQEIRYGGDYTILVNINEGLMKYKILKLTLQPLVENALIHGIRQNQTDGKIIISGYMKNDNIFIEIEDNGKGISEQVIKNIFNEEKQNNNSDLFNGTGIKNIHERIKLYFGHQYGLKIMNINPGTRVVVTIPARKE